MVDSVEAVVIGAGVVGLAVARRRAALCQARARQEGARGRRKEGGEAQGGTVGEGRGQASSSPQKEGWEGDAGAFQAREEEVF